MVNRKAVRQAHGKKIGEERPCLSEIELTKKQNPEAILWIFLRFFYRMTRLRILPPKTLISFCIFTNVGQKSNTFLVWRIFSYQGFKIQYIGSGWIFIEIFLLALNLFLSTIKYFNIKGN